ncbi:MmcQ/YjbR family DNA-binding protein [Deinococcus arenicola]|uniref:MmcQ/YjbR family DNA-binding protein n=1 Tax=Deinococcus arenicola TaxID=2994950 RepID=A0ABU4DKN3_9DEIO|nr:MmcQ/YjbR family DNA-binding protein [Deinococcus sp. ZS9-10]MDV6372993.1 MmcQ/YjbR family DNA-binding protein [Deinococcus sp. ZS9-10]
MQTVAQLREACGRLAHSQETFPFGPDTLVFKVGGKVYALSDIRADPLKLSLKVRPAQADELRAAHAAIVPGYHLNKRHWITATLDGTLPDALVEELLAGSHALVLKGMTRPARAELGL